MDIETIKNLKYNLQNQIADLLQNFSNQTKVYIDDMNLDTMKFVTISDIGQEQYIYQVNIVIKL